jgi:hypothetical protein
MSDLEYLNGFIVPFPTLFSRIMNILCLVLVVIGLFASLWLLATNFFRCKSSSTKLLLSTITADFIMFIASCVSLTRNEITGGFSLGEFGCFVNYYFVVTLPCISIATLGVTAWERYQIVCKGNQWSEAKIHFYIVMIWISTCMIVALPFFTSSPEAVQLLPNLLCCSVRWYGRSAIAIIMTASVLAMSTASFSVVIFSYYNVYITYRNAARNSSSSFSSDSPGMVFHKCLMMTISVVVFWTPFYFIIIYEIVTGTSAGPDYISLANLIAFLCPALNPLIMFKYDNRVRGNMLELYHFFTNHFRRKELLIIHPQEPATPMQSVI